jgi:hypothetical protein
MLKSQIKWVLTTDTSKTQLEITFQTYFKILNNKTNKFLKCGSSHRPSFVCPKITENLSKAMTRHSWVPSSVLEAGAIIPHDHLLLDSVPNIGPLISRWEFGKLKNCWNNSFRAFKILTLLYQQFSNLLISQRDVSGPRLGALTNNRWSGDTICINERSMKRVF